jgi:predicted RNA-binding protein with PIN domain
VRYLVDGNNVMGQRVGFHRDRAGARRRLVDELERFARRGGDTVEVVFDGQPSGSLPGSPSEGQGRDAPAGLREGGVRVTYAGRGADADTRIRELVGQAPAERRPVVVTSDRRLAEDVRRLGAEVLRSGELRRRLDALPPEDEDAIDEAGPAAGAESSHDTGPRAGAESEARE